MTHGSWRRRLINKTNGRELLSVSGCYPPIGSLSLPLLLLSGRKAQPVRRSSPSGAARSLAAREDRNACSYFSSSSPPPPLLPPLPRSAQCVCTHGAPLSTWHAHGALIGCSAATRRRSSDRAAALARLQRSALRPRCPLFTRALA